MNNRRQFIVGTATVGVLTSLGTVVAQDGAVDKLDPEMVGKFVSKSHGDIETIKSLLKDEPALVNCAWDWGGGDWETGLGAASHVGRKEIVKLLLDNGARLDAFAASTLGMSGVIKEMLKVKADLHATPGPHGIPMLSHAIFGREEADNVFYQLLESGADVNAASNMNMTPLMAAVSLSRIGIVKELLKRNADPTIKDVKGISILDVAKRRKDEEVTKLIEEAIAAR